MQVLSATFQSVTEGSFCPDERRADRWKVGDDKRPIVRQVESLVGESLECLCQRFRNPHPNVESDWELYHIGEEFGPELGPVTNQVQEEAGSEEESLQDQLGAWKHGQELLEDEFSDCASSVSQESHAATEVCSSPQPEDSGLEEIKESFPAFDPQETAKADNSEAAAKAERAEIENVAAAMAVGPVS